MAGRKFVLVGDLGTDHEGFPPTPVISGSPNVFMDGKPMARVGDPLAPHAKPHHPPHPRTITSGEPRFIINGMEAAVTGGTISCDGVTIGTGSGEVNGVSSPAAFSSGAAISPDADSGAGKQSLTNNTAASYASAAATQLTETRSPSPAEPDLPNTDVRKRSEQLASKTNGSDDSPANRSNNIVAESSEEPSGQSPKPDQPAIRVEAGIFFDGTGNNRDNSAAYNRKVDECLTAHATGAISEEACSAEISQLMEGSYLNAETNVSKLHTLYQPFSSTTLTVENHRLRVYVSGVGTKSGEEDDAWNMGTGTGDRGILAKMAWGCDRLARLISRDASAPIDELVLDVFSFSRGAATARHFVNEVRDGAGGALGQAFQKLGIVWPKTVTIRFLGLFDTVAAVADVMGGDFSAHDAETGAVRVGLAAGAVQRAVHLTARDERRYNFSLNSLRGPDGNLPAHFSEWVLPGVHSDIGGGYPADFREHIQVAQPRHYTGYHPRQSHEYAWIMTARRRVEGEGWLGPYNPDGTLTIEEAHRRRLHEGEITLQFQLWLDRRVQTEYSRIALRQMYRLAKDAGVPLDAVKPTDTGFSLPDELQSIASRIAHHINEDLPLRLSAQEEDRLRQRYIHHSAHYLAAGPLYPFEPAPGGVRAIHPNKGLA